jgi:hypothetical protein
MLGVFSQFERSIIQERVLAGIARARAKGTLLYRPIQEPAPGEPFNANNMLRFSASAVSNSEVAGAILADGKKALLHLPPGTRKERRVARGFFHVSGGAAYLSRS